jgi:hypothetical protein
VAVSLLLVIGGWYGRRKEERKAVTKAVRKEVRRAVA